MQELNEDLKSMEVIMDRHADGLRLTWRTVEADAAGVHAGVLEWASQSGCHGSQAIGELENWSQNVRDQWDVCHHLKLLK